MSQIKLIVGLANPGPQYQDTRHNAGAWFIEELARSFQVSLSPDSKFFGSIGRSMIANTDVRLLIPSTFMNLSGKSIAAVAQFFKLEPENILVAHDELDIAPGEVRLKKGGGHGGHNGIRDTISSLGNDNNFYRLRVGIGHPGNKSQVTGYVLGKPAKEDREKIDQAIYESVRTIETIVKGEHDKAMQYLHSLN